MPNKARRCSEEMLGPALRRLGIELETDCQVFWDLCASHMSCEEDKAACAAIGHELKSSYFALFVESMLSLTHDQVTQVITKCGGKPEWIGGIETILRHKFSKLALNAPAW